MISLNFQLQYLMMCYYSSLDLYLHSADTDVLRTLQNRWLQVSREFVELFTVVYSRELTLKLIKGLIFVTDKCFDSYRPDKKLVHKSNRELFLIDVTSGKENREGGAYENKEVPRDGR